MRAAFDAKVVTGRRGGVVKMRTAVVFPAPLGPRKPNTVPDATSRSMPRNASTVPKFLRSPSATMAPAIGTPYGVQPTTTAETEGGASEQKVKDGHSRVTA